MHTGDAAINSARRPLTGPDEVTFTLLGPVEVLRDGADHAPTTPKVRQLLALLLTRPGEVIHIDSIIQELWANRPPRSVRTTVHTYVHHLRRIMEQLGYAPDAVLVTRTPGYQLRIAPAQVDVSAFHRECQQGRDLLRRQEFLEAAARFRAAQAVWSGPPLANVHCGPLLTAYGVQLLEQRRHAQDLRIEAEISGGAHRELIGELRALAAANPLDEGVHGQLMRVLGRSGRRSDAMASYRQLRARLNEELGVEPCGELQLLHRQLLSDGHLKAS
ncbi:AfsR/SARP family transcriptional regulator [Amycolatopsis suaedae]|uniref:SARP family transcriptional regulator n=1 Tax=Amycolatopsis suaedae TaxID=2510978 RepID=A0A4Q7J178_9PSEU|nr:AfsR/SARP family transcriptional regulator [Amycolatopsis suaedae]RZQ61141.1 SARP family transcriptional regulator [Amycolatopsis suaedae]